MLGELWYAFLILNDATFTPKLWDTFINKTTFKPNQPFKTKGPTLFTETLSLSLEFVMLSEFLSRLSDNLTLRE